jgi:hypothetical protein
MCSSSQPEGSLSGWLNRLIEVKSYGGQNEFIFEGSQ